MLDRYDLGDTMLNLDLKVMMMLFINAGNLMGAKAYMKIVTSFKNRFFVQISHKRREKKDFKRAGNG